MSRMDGKKTHTHTLLRKFKKKKALHGIERVPQYGYITLITMYLNQKNSDQVYGIEKNNLKNEV